MLAKQIIYKYSPQTMPYYIWYGLGTRFKHMLRKSNNCNGSATPETSQ